MNRLFKYIFLAFAVLSSAACTGTVDPDSQVPEGALRIFVDKTEFVADGSDEVVFKVMFGSQDVSEDKGCQLIRTFNGEEKTMAPGANRYSTFEAGVYKFKAKYFYKGHNYTDNELEVVAKPFLYEGAKNYKRRFLATLFTSTECSSCPNVAKDLKSLQEENPGQITVAAYHHFMAVSDPMEVQETIDLKDELGGFTGLPTLFWNFRKSSKSGGMMVADSFMTEQDEFETISGVSIATDFDKESSKLDISLGITSNKPVAFRYVVILLEDGISSKTGKDYEQAGIREGVEYIHNNVVRKSLTEPLGKSINEGKAVKPGVEVTATETVTLDPAWNPENMRVVVAALTSVSNIWTANNVNECKVGESVSYLYEE